MCFCSGEFWLSVGAMATLRRQLRGLKQVIIAIDLPPYFPIFPHTWCPSLRQSWSAILRAGWRSRVSTWSASLWDRRGPSRAQGGEDIHQVRRWSGYHGDPWGNSSMSCAKFLHIPPYSSMNCKVRLGDVCRFILPSFSYFITRNPSEMSVIHQLPQVKFHLSL